MKDNKFAKYKNELKTIQINTFISVPTKHKTLISTMTGPQLDY